jgi:hypothetical protein
MQLMERVHGDQQDVADVAGQGLVLTFQLFSLPQNNGHVARV